MEPPFPAAAHLVAGIEDLVEIGRGGAAVVYRGRQPDLARDVAVKVVASRGTPEADLARWRREVTAMARLSNHPNIVAVYDGGTTADGLPYIVMPYVPGGTLGDRLRGDGPLPADDVVAIGSKLAAAVAAAHAAGVLHRDMKPDNVLLSPYGEPQLTDFGIARLLDATFTATHGIHATVVYAAPEVLAGEPAGEASDVYGLGATLHACLTGSAPFVPRDGEPLVALAVRITAEPPPDLRARGVPDALAAVVDQAMAKDPRDRIPTAAALGQRLDQIAADDAPSPRHEPTATAALPVTEPATPPPPAPRPEPVPQPSRPRRGPTVAVAALVLVVLGAVAAVALANRDGDGDGPAGPEPTAAAEDDVETPPGTTDLRAATLAYFEALDGGDLEAAYAMTSPGFQAAQPFDGYAEFWGGLGTISVAGEPTLDEAALTAAVDLRLGGGREIYTLSFVRADDGSLLIDGPRPR